MNTEIKNPEKKDDKKVATIIVNATPKEWNEKNISFEQVVIVAFGSYVNNDAVVYTVNYKRGEGHKPEGTMVKGESIHVKDKMIFNVTQTNRS
jgi:hypothetical protein